MSFSKDFIILYKESKVKACGCIEYKLLFSKDVIILNKEYKLCHLVRMLAFFIETINCHLVKILSFLMKRVK